ncbi:MAG: ROK family protein [Rhodothermales bacterium]|nr:ROK family protein [Rhodothermales bacterium]
MILGIEIGGTKLQVGLADQPGESFKAFVRQPVNRDDGAQGILTTLAEVCKPIISKHPVTRIGIGFGGPVDSINGVVRKSHHVKGWENFNLAKWCRSELGHDGVVDNDCNVCALAEAKYGAGKGLNSVFYVTVGTGIGGGLYVNGNIFGADRPAIVEIGHLRPAPVEDPLAIVEDYCSGLGIAKQYLDKLKAQSNEDPAIESITAKEIASAARHGDALSRQIMEEAVQVLGWAIAQAITMTAPEIVVVGGGVSMASNSVFMHPLRKYVDRYVMTLLAGTYQVRRAQLGEEVVVHGAVALAALPQ